MKKKDRTLEKLRAPIRCICWGCAPEMGYALRSGMTYTIGRCDGPCGERGMVARPEQYTKLQPAAA